jgi:hypothetical protein
MVHARHPVGVHRGLLLFRILTPVPALDIRDKRAMIFYCVGRCARRPNTR